MRGQRTIILQYTLIWLAIANGAITIATVTSGITSPTDFSASTEQYGGVTPGTREKASTRPASKKGQNEKLSTTGRSALAGKKETTPGSPSSRVPGILIGSQRSAACSQVPAVDMDNFKLCFFLQLRNESSNMINRNTILDVRVAVTSIIEICYGPDGRFSVNIQGHNYSYHKLLEFNDWTKICVIKPGNLTLIFEINNLPVEVEETFERNISISSEEHGTYLDGTSVRMCVGSDEIEKSSFIGSIAGITLTQVDAKDYVTEETIEVDDNVYDFSSYIEDYGEYSDDYHYGDDNSTTDDYNNHTTDYPSEYDNSTTDDYNNHTTDYPSDYDNFKTNSYNNPTNTDDQYQNHSHDQANNTVDSEVTKDASSVSCINQMDEGSFVTTKLLSKLATVKGNITKELYAVNELCWKTLVPFLIESAADHSEHTLRCQELRGRLILIEEIKAFSRRFNFIFTNKTSYKQKHPTVFNKHIWLNHKERTNQSHCLAYNFADMRLVNLSCNMELEQNVCFIPKYSDFRIYGPVGKYGRHYTLQTDNGSVILKGDFGSTLTKIKDQWSLQSQFHQRILTLPNKMVPFGRNKWRDSVSDYEYHLTVTNCGKNEFACSNGNCIPLSKRCNDAEDCIDASDEEECTIIKKAHGYNKNEFPLQKIKEENFSCEYSLSIDSISKVSAEDGAAKVAMTFQTYWNDSRINFTRSAINRALNSSQFWLPNWIFQDVKQVNLIYETPLEILGSTGNGQCVPEMNEPYMDHYCDDGVQLLHKVKIVLSIPCDFNFRRYPFGYHSCSIKGSVRGKNIIINNVQYNEYKGTTDLGDFYFEESPHRLSEDNKFFNLTIRLHTMYGYHMINSFAPSFLVYLICFATLFFSINEFNERFVGSMTALLVLVALSIQTSEKAVRTSYLKYLDIWFAVLLLLCFLVTIANVCVHKLLNYEKKKLISKMSEMKDGSYEIPSNTYFKNVYWFNKSFEILFTLVTLSFLLYSLSSAEFI